MVVVVWPVYRTVFVGYDYFGDTLGRGLTIVEDREFQFTGGEPTTRTAGVVGNLHKLWIRLCLHWSTGNS